MRRFSLAFSTLITGCVIEQIDAVIDQRGVTDCPSSTGSSEASASTSTSTSTSTDTTVDGEGSGTSTSDMETGSQESVSGSSSTGQAIPMCGDGVVEGEETCDDGNAIPGDGCQECSKDSIIFITSEVYQGFALGGLYGADQRCRSLAAKAGLQNPLAFKAWLSTPDMPATDRLSHSRGRYVLVNGLVVAQDWNALTSGTLVNPIIVDESSVTQDSLAWTGTLANGQPSLGTEFCKDWNDESGQFELGGIGLSASLDATWSFFGDNGCFSEAHLYCVEQ